MHNQHLIYPCHVIQEEKAQPYKSPRDKNSSSHRDKIDHKGELFICNLFQRRMYNINDMRVVNTDALSYQNKLPEKYCLTVEEEKNGIIW